MGKNCLVEIKDRVGIITINRPPLNTLSRNTLYEIHTHLEEMEHNDIVGAILLTGAGNESFSAGADVTEFADFGDPAQAKEAIQRIHQLFRRIELYPKPVIASINGRALGGGCELQMACHLVIASEKAEFALPEIKLGIMPGYGGTQRLPRLIGQRRALDMILSGKPITAMEALEYGLINKIVPDELLMETSLSFASSLAEGPPLAMRAILDSVIKGTEANIEEGIAIEFSHMETITSSEDAAEGISAFLTKRKPQFSGR